MTETEEIQIRSIDEIEGLIKALRMQLYSIDHQDPDNTCELCNYWRMRFKNDIAVLFWVLKDTETMSIDTDQKMKEKGHSNCLFRNPNA